MPLTLAPPRPSPTADPPTPLPPDRGRGFLARLFAGDFPFPAVSPAALPPGACRSAAEHDAAARALGCRDLFVIAAPDPDPRERALAAVARAAAARGERVLVLSPDPAAADRVTERVGADVVRALAPDENPFRPSAVAARLTSAALGAGRVEQLKRDAAATIAELEAAQVGAGRRAELEAEAVTLAARRDSLDAEARAEAGAAGLDPARADLAARHEAAVKAKSEKEAAAAALRQQLAECGKKGGFLTRLFKGKGTGPESADLEKHLHDLEREAAELAAAADALAAGVAAADARLAADREKRAADAVASRRAEAEARLAELAAERDRLPADPPADLDRRLAAARDTLAALTRDPAGAAARLLAAIPVVVGTPGCLDADPVFESHPAFDLLVLDHAEELTEPDFVSLARRADRWVLAGDVPDPPRGGPRRPDTFLGRLARLLDRERFAAEGTRLVCRLAHPTPDQWRAMTREPLLDRPAVELRFVPGDGEAVLAEIAFPPGTTPADAKRLIAHELGTVLLRPCGETVRRLTDAEPHVCWPAADAGQCEWVDLAPGVREKVAGGYTAAVTFDPAHGWDAAAAEAWLAEHLPPAPGRVAALPRVALPVPRPVAVGT